MSRHLLLISYTFPPYPGIGGRRWAKFAKHLSKLGFTVHVVLAKNPFKEESLWMRDIKDNPKIKLYELKGWYPKILMRSPESILEKVKYKFSLFTVNLLSKGTPYDRSTFWKSAMLKTSTHLIKKYQIKNIITSCAPFSAAYYSLQLTKRFPGLNLMVDLRDPWTWGTGYGFTNLKKNKFEYEKMMEQQVVQCSDFLLVPTGDMKNYLDGVYPSYSHKIIVIPHGFDRDEVVRTEKKHSEKIKLLFYGTLYASQNDVFENIASALKVHQNKISLDIYSSSETYKQSFEKRQLIGTSVNYRKPLPPVELFNKIGACDYVLIIQPDYAKDFITTKIYEIIYSGTPIVLISAKGLLSDFITENNLGVWIIPENTSVKFETLLNAKLDSFKISQFPIENYSYESVTAQLIQYIK